MPGAALSMHMIGFDKSRLNFKTPLRYLGASLMLAGLFIVVHAFSPSLKTYTQFTPDTQDRGFIPMLDPGLSRHQLQPGGGHPAIQGDETGSVSGMAGSPGEAMGGSSGEASPPGAAAQGEGDAISNDPASMGLLPTYISIPRIHLGAPVVEAKLQTVDVDGQSFRQWSAPDWLAAGWDTGSARLGAGGNTVLVGHHNEFGEVFRYLVSLSEGDKVIVWSGDVSFEYKVALILVLPESGQPLSKRLDNATWIEPTNDDRLTLVTCWPYSTNTHRLIIVAKAVPLAPSIRGIQ
jgi:LPXTG-site transpeptidase (sortase) family protein